jgi:hypothetical protein
LVNAANIRKFVKGKSSFNPKICTLCGLPDYSIEICYKKHCFPPGFKFFYATTINNISGDTLSVQVEDVQPQKQSISPSFSLEDFSMLIDLTKQAKRRMCQSVIGMICKDRCVVGQSSIDVYKTYA